MRQHRYAPRVLYGLYRLFYTGAAGRGIGGLAVSDIFFKSFLPRLNEALAPHQVGDMRPPVGAVRGGVEFLKTHIQSLFLQQIEYLFYAHKAAGAEILQPAQKYRIFKVQTVAEDVQVVVVAGAYFYTVKIPDAQLLQPGLDLSPPEADVMVGEREITYSGLCDRGGQFMGRERAVRTPGMGVEID